MLTAYYFFVFNSYKAGIIDVSASYVSYDNANSLVDSAELVIVASPIADFDDREHDITTYLSGAVEDFSTKTELKVQNVLKGDLNEEFLSVIEPISYVQNLDGKQKITREGYVEMQKDHEYLIALKKNSFGEYSVINMTNGVFDLNTPETNSSSFTSHNAASDSFSIEEGHEHNLKHEEMRSDLLNMFNL